MMRAMLQPTKRTRIGRAKERTVLGDPPEPYRDRQRKVGRTSALPAGAFGQFEQEKMFEIEILGELMEKNYKQV